MIKIISKYQQEKFDIEKQLNDIQDKLNGYLDQISQLNSDRNELFEGIAQKEDRSNMNATFILKQNKAENIFNEMCEKEGINGLKGHRSVGGYRASMYNALPLESVEKLINIMQKLENKI